MAHTRKDTLTAPRSWRKHFTAQEKRKYSKRERRAGRRYTAAAIGGSIS